MTTSETEKSSDDKEFTIQSNEKFQKKNDAIFGSLVFLEQKHEAYEKVRSKTDDYIKSDPDEDRTIDDRPTKGHAERGRFSHRGAGGRRGRARHAPYIPMHRREPKNWTMYDLSDVDQKQMSEKSTKAAAISFLSDLKKRNKSGEDIQPVADLSEKVVFKKPTISDSENLNREATTSSGKWTMPEFNFGSKKEKKKKELKSEQKEPGEKTIRLSHLDDEDGEDN